jgi:hypothetical protein
MIMRAGFRWSLCLLLGLVCVPVVQSADVPAKKTVLDYLMQMQSDMMAPIVEHCARAVPATRADLDKEFGAFKDKLKLAAQPLMRRIDQAGLAEPTREEASQMQEMIKALSTAQLEEVRKVDPAMYCPSVVAKVRAVSVENLRTSIEAAYDQYAGASAAPARAAGK